MAMVGRNTVEVGVKPDAEGFAATLRVVPFSTSRGSKTFNPPEGCDTRLSSKREGMPVPAPRSTVEYAEVA